MKNTDYILIKNFEPLDDLYFLLESMEKILNIKITSDDYIIGRKQLYYIFLHETAHAFITKAANWIHKLKEDETDFVDEVVVRILIDDLIKKLNIYEKLDLYYENHVDHKTELKYYGFNLAIENYLEIENVWILNYAKSFRIDDFCKYVLEYYRNNYEKLKRDDNFKYKGK